MPLRFILTSFKANLEWDGIFQIITLTLGNNRMRLQIGNLRADVNGNLKMLPTAPVLVKGVTFVPLRFISENFGADVKWDGTLKAVSIVYPKP
ncbi:copper amine oxidase N-terminal domain-containing protein [Caldisericum sp.]|uniref:copper amine oxidase N-terminal domain-containing protein n=1 Tax=Caldisericum sp. TaxID=2499687 RepID=UPI003D0E9453